MCEEDWECVHNDTTLYDRSISLVRFNLQVSMTKTINLFLLVVW